MRVLLFTISLLGLAAAQSKTSQSASASGGDGGFGAFTSQIGQLTVNSGVPSGMKPSAQTDTLSATDSIQTSTSTRTTASASASAQATSKSSPGLAAPTLHAGTGLLGAGLVIVAML